MYYQVGVLYYHLSNVYHYLKCFQINQYNGFSVLLISKTDKQPMVTFSPK